MLSSGGLLAWIQCNRGDMDLALDTCTETRRWVEQHYADPSQPRLISCWLNAALTEIYRERNQPQAAATHLEPLLEHVNQGTEPGQHVIIQHVRGHLAFSDGRYQEAKIRVNKVVNGLSGQSAWLPRLVSGACLPKRALVCGIFFLNYRA